MKVTNPFRSIAPDNASRRAFLARTSALSVLGGAMPWALTLSAMGDAAAQQASDYRALVCVYLYGGNDQANTIVPYDSASYNEYARLRSGLALSRDSLNANVLTPASALPDGRQFALAPSLAPLKSVWDAGKMSVALNVGTLVQPTTRDQYLARSVPLPPKLFSHNDQQAYWQALNPTGPINGWGGRMGDLFASSNPASSFTSISVSGHALFLDGGSSRPYQMQTNGPVPFYGTEGFLSGSSACSNALRQLLTQDRPHLFESAYVDTTRRALESYEKMSSALASAQVSTAFPGGDLAGQLKLVARLIKARQSLGVRRQVFMVSLGGFDTHDNLIARHNPLLTQVGGAMRAFYDATVELGVANSVTAFTASDFGRTLTSNSGGSDHGWGSMHMVVGGNVKGRSFFGRAPVYANNGPDDVGQGRWVPSISVEQMAATMAGWFGVSASEQATILPNLRNFSNTNQAFMA